MGASSKRPNRPQSKEASDGKKAPDKKEIQRRNLEHERRKKELSDMMLESLEVRKACQTALSALTAATKASEALNTKMAGSTTGIRVSGIIRSRLLSTTLRVAREKIMSTMRIGDRGQRQVVELFDDLTTPDQS